MIRFISDATSAEAISCDAVADGGDDGEELAGPKIGVVNGMTTGGLVHPPEPQDCEVMAAGAVDCEVNTPAGLALLNGFGGCAVTMPGCVLGPDDCEVVEGQRPSPKAPMLKPVSVTPFPAPLAEAFPFAAAAAAPFAASE
jgi:hypothetical protein